MANFEGVLLDWVGTLVVPMWGPAVGARPRGAAWIERALAALGRDPAGAEVGRISAALDGAGARPDVRDRWAGADLSVEAFRERFGFHAALAGLGLSPDEALMVGDRSAYDGGGVEAGLTTLLLPPLGHPGQRRLHLVLATCGVPALS